MKKKLLPIILSLVFVFSSFMTITAFAATPVNQDGLEASLASSKSTYAANEDIDLTLTVKNNNTYAVNGIRTAITLPDGITVKTGSLTQTAFNLAAGESKTTSQTIIKMVKVAPSPTPVNKTDSPKTGDNSNLTLWLALMLISAGSLVFLVIKNKKIKGNGMLSLFLCLAVIGAVGLPITANAAGTEKSLTVTEDLTVDGKTVTISANISYDHVAYNKVTVTGGTGSNTYAQGEKVTITANKPESGNSFTGWTVVSGGVVLANDKDATTTFTMPDKPVEIKANYLVDTFTITASAGENGTITPTGTTDVSFGGTQTYTFTPNEGYHVADVLVDGASLGEVAECTFDDVKADHIIMVKFEKDTYTVTVNNGGVRDYTGAANSVATVEWGETVTIVADNPAAGKEFKDWSVVSGNVTLADSTKSLTTFTMPKEDVEVSVNYQPSKLAADAEAAKISLDTLYTRGDVSVVSLSYSEPLLDNTIFNISKIQRTHGNQKIDLTYSWDAENNLITINIGTYGDSNADDMTIYWNVTVDGTVSTEQEEYFLVRN